MTDPTATDPALPRSGQTGCTEQPMIREVTNLAWPQSTYSSAHRPISTPTRLLTGLWIGPQGWAAVHLPLHRTRTLDAATARLGIQATGHHRSPTIDDTDTNGDIAGDPHLWAGLDRLLLAARRQAIAVAGLQLAVPLQRAHQHLAHAGARAPGIASLLPEWPNPSPAPPDPVTARARLLELAHADLPDAAAALLARHTATPRRTPRTGTHDMAAGVAAAAAAALAAATWISAYDLDENLDLAVLLEDTIGDQLTFTREASNAAVPAEDSLR